MKLKRTSLGEFEELVLLTICMLDEQAYGVSIKEKIQDETDRQLSISAVHSVLNRLEKKGFVTSWMGGETKERGGRRKRFFKITNSGRQALIELRELRERMWQLIPEAALQTKLT